MRFVFALLWKDWSVFSSTSLIEGLCPGDLHGTEAAYNKKTEKNTPVAQPFCICKETGTTSKASFGCNLGSVDTSNIFSVRLAASATSASSFLSFLCGSSFRSDLDPEKISVWKKMKHCSFTFFFALQLLVIISLILWRALAVICKQHLGTIGHQKQTQTANLACYHCATLFSCKRIHFH